MQYKRTPDVHFDNLPGYSFRPNYQSVDDGQGGKLRVHYVDEGPQDGQVVLLMHGEPSWSYLYRKMIPGLVAAGYRVLAPDLIGFGRSDKPESRDDYTYQSHVDWMTQWLIRLDLNRVVLFCQDWGGLIGLRLVAGQQIGFWCRGRQYYVAHRDVPAGRLSWPGNNTPKGRNFDVGSIIDRAVVSELSPEIVAAYNAPYPDDSYKAGARKFPLLVPTTPDDPAAKPNREAWKILAASNIPFLTALVIKIQLLKGEIECFKSCSRVAMSKNISPPNMLGIFYKRIKEKKLAELIITFINDNGFNDSGEQAG